MPEISAINAEWIAVIPYAFSRENDPKVHYSDKGFWWGESPEGMRETITLAKANCLKVMLKPQVYMHNSWVGDMDFRDEASWKIWEDTYRAYVWPIVEFAAESGVEMICIGTEYRIAAVKREAFWRALIKDIRSVYAGKITYGANWDDYQSVPFWEELDYIGISAYFPLTDSHTPNTKELKKKWKPVVKELDAFSSKMQKNILFTEFGYMGVDKCAWRTWELEQNKDQLTLNERAQSNAMEAIFHVFWEQDFWAGGFLWKWFPNISEDKAAGYKDYTPQGKLAMHTVKSWYTKE